MLVMAAGQGWGGLLCERAGGGERNRRAEADGSRGGSRPTAPKPMAWGVDPDRRRRSRWLGRWISTIGAGADGSLGGGGRT
jgi:hypothetical protein